VLAALACLAGFAVAELDTSSSGQVASRLQTASPTGTVTPQAAPPRKLLAGPGATRPVAVASVAKVMTAYVVLHDHPLPANGPGPDIAVQPSEAAAYPSQARGGDSLVPVTAGETITERQALEALLLPVARMNATARHLGMAAMPAAVVPEAGVVRNYNTLLGQAGIVGLKTGHTQAAGGCVLIAAGDKVSGRNTLIVAAAFAQPGTAETMLPNALRAGPGTRQARHGRKDPSAYG
jgi:D-alanyl-D-alanine carboxypeptidase